MHELSIAAVTGYAFADAIDPCSLSVLTLILVAVVTRASIGRKFDRKGILAAGLSFVFAVFLAYFSIGLAIMLAFRTLEASMGFMMQTIYMVLGALAVAIGLVSIRDFFRPKSHGKSAIEMLPSFLKLRTIKTWGENTGLGEAFVLGLLTTLLLAPMTMGPYLITNGILSTISLASSLPWLAFYNIIFVFPMLLLTLIVYMKYEAVGRASEWRKKERYLHLAAGLIMLVLGSLMIAGLV